MGEAAEKENLTHIFEVRACFFTNFMNLITNC